MKVKHLVVCLMTIIAISCSNDDQTETENPDNTQVLSPFGVNLAGAEFDEDNMPGTLDQQYTYPNAAELDYYNSKGLKLIRLPYRWERLQGEFGGALETENLI